MAQHGYVDMTVCDMICVQMLQVLVDFQPTMQACIEQKMADSTKQWMEV